MGAKWHRVVAEADPDVMIVQDGVAREGIRLSVPDEVYYQIKSGYQCINCLEPLSEAYPEHCPLCGFEMKEKQAEVFGAVFKGYRPGVRTGPDWEAEADRIEEKAERRAFARKMEKQGVSVPSIIVPKSLG